MPSSEHDQAYKGLKALEAEDAVGGVGFLEAIMLPPHFIPRFGHPRRMDMNKENIAPRQACFS
jgi:hypothetical protein